MRFVIALSLAIVLACPATAHAQMNEKPLKDKTVEAAMRVADAYWQARGMAAACGPADLRLARMGTPGLGAIDGCELWVSYEFWYILVDIHEWDRSGRVAHFADLCLVLVHERGHNIGLGHAERGVMKSGATFVPRACRDWARHWDAKYYKKRA